MGDNAVAGGRELADENENLALRPGVAIATSASRPSGGGARDPAILLNETAHRLDGRPLSDYDRRRTFDTFDGWNAAEGRDWYAIELAEPSTISCIEMTMGFPYRDGGWWTSLDVEVRRPADDRWMPVANLHIAPSYNVADRRAERRPFETYGLTFDPVSVAAVRVCGQPGGLSQFTSLARLAVYRRDLSQWNPLTLSAPPLPRVFRLIPPRTVYTFSDSLATLCGLTVTLPLMEYYLDEQRFQQVWRRLSANYRGEPELWFVVGQAMGWSAWNGLNAAPEAEGLAAPREPYVRTLFHDTLALACAPIVVDGSVIGEMTTQRVILDDTADPERHHALALRYGIDWPQYQAAMARTVHKARVQMEAAAALMGTFAHSVADLAHHLDQATVADARRSAYDREVVRQAIDIMERNLEAPITVTAVAQALHLSLPYFSKLFAAQTGSTPSAYLIDLRIARAKEYLAHTTMPVQIICNMLGYDASYFSRLFKRHTGYTPGAYARMARVH